MMRCVRNVVFCVLGVVFVSENLLAEPLIIDHNHRDVTELTEDEIHRAKDVLHIGYGHTSHGSQLTTGMNGLVGFANGGGQGMSYSNNIFAWNNGGTGGALDLHDEAMGGDCGYYPQWVNNTTSYLDDPANSNVNVIIWSWCGQMSDKWSGGSLSNEYLIPMSNLETSYPDVVFVYMTGHVDIWDDSDQKGGAQAIRDYCTANDKVLYDFSDIERYNPDGTYFEYVHDTCDYYATNGGSGYQGNWATEWQGAHTETVDWYDCGSLHSQPLNANQKAYAAWHLWTSIAYDLDRDGIGDEWEERYGSTDTFKSGTNDCDGDGVCDYHEFIADSNPTNESSFFQISDMNHTNSQTVSFACSSNRIYSLQCSTNLLDLQWDTVAGQTNVQGEGDGILSMTDTNEYPLNNYRVQVSLP
ncbi:hypothetical protein H8D64_02795 [PVC group bacterium]|nr:hypothetical protein [PVC group bacterium]